MSIIQKFKDFNLARKRRKIKKFEKLVKNPKAIKEDRSTALEFFKRYPEAEVSVPILLSRFEYSLEHGIADSREKDIAFDGIIKHEDEALPFVREHLNQTNKLAWPVKILTKLTGDNEVKETLLKSLNAGDIAFDQALVDKNYDILCYLADFDIGDEWKKIIGFLNDPDERVRFAAVEVLSNQKQDGIKEYIAPFLLDDSNENRRIRMTVIQSFLENDWKVDNPKAFPEGPLVEGVFVTKKGKLERRH